MKARQLACRVPALSGHHHVQPAQLPEGQLSLLAGTIHPQGQPVWSEQLKATPAREQSTLMSCGGGEQRREGWKSSGLDLSTEEGGGVSPASPSWLRGGPTLRTPTCQEAKPSPGLQRHSAASDAALVTKKTHNTFHGFLTGQTFIGHNYPSFHKGSPSGINKLFLFV